MQNNKETLESIYVDFDSLKEGTVFYLPAVGYCIKIKAKETNINNALNNVSLELITVKSKEKVIECECKLHICPVIVEIE